MPNDFIVRPKCTDKKEDKSITMTIRLERELQEQYDDLSAKSGRSRNELMCMAANYAQTECQFRYCGTAIPFLTVRSTAR